MNYISEIKAFYDWVETNPLSSPAINMWHALMHIANKTGWKQQFAVSISVLEVKTGLKRQALLNARNVLKQCGRIEWESRSGNQSAVYRIISFADVRQTQTDTQGDTQTENPKFVDVKRAQSDTHTDTQTDTQGDTHTDTINKLNITKLNEEDKDNNVGLNDQVKEIWDYYNQGFGSFYPRGLTLTKDRKTKIAARLKEGQSVDLIKTAIDNIRKSNYHCGENDTGKVYATIEFICRNGGKVEEWANYEPANGGDRYGQSQGGSGPNGQAVQNGPGGVYGSGNKAQRGPSVSTDKGSGAFSKVYD